MIRRGMRVASAGQRPRRPVQRGRARVNELASTRPLRSMVKLNVTTPSCRAADAELGYWRYRSRCENSMLIQDGENALALLLPGAGADGMLAV